MLTALHTRLQSYNKRERYVWIVINRNPNVYFGWVLGINDTHIKFKDDEKHCAVRLEISEIESCGAV